MIHTPLSKGLCPAVILGASLVPSNITQAQTPVGPKAETSTLFGHFSQSVLPKLQSYVRKLSFMAKKCSRSLKHKYDHDLPCLKPHTERLIFQRIT